MHSVMNHNFSQVPSVEIPRSSFDRSHGHKTAFDVDYLIPIYVDEALPGDTFQMDATIFGRLATPIFPIMDNMSIDVHFFKVPCRLLQTNFVKMMGERDNPDDHNDYLCPIVNAPTGGFTQNSIYDYMGIPTKKEGISVNALFLRAYNKIYNDWYRDQNLIDSLSVPLTDGPDNQNLYTLQKRAKRPDYFTSCLPWPQKGPSVPLPLGGTAPVIGNGTCIGLYDGTDVAGLESNNGAIFAWKSDAGHNVGQASTFTGTLQNRKGVGLHTSADKTGMVADLSDATASTINQLRQAFQLQRMYERDARGGTRYIEQVLSHFGVRSPDARLQRSEYLGGGSSAININPVVQTSGDVTGAVTPQGNVAAYGNFANGNIGFFTSFTEHCIVIGIANVKSDLTYSQGLNKMFSRRARTDFYWPALAHLGEQAVLNREIYAQGTADDDLVFGYQERFAEYRYKPSVITGIMRPNATGTLKSWHLSQEFSSLPLLNQSFKESNTPLARCLAVETEPHILFDSYFKLKCARPMPVYSVPGLIDHF